MDWVANHRGLNSIARKWTPHSAPRNFPVFAFARPASKAPRSFLKNDGPPTGDLCPKPFRVVVGCSLLPTFVLEPQHKTPRRRGCLPHGGKARRRHQDDRSVLRPAAPTLFRTQEQNRRALSIRCVSGRTLRRRDLPNLPRSQCHEKSKCYRVDRTYPRSRSPCAHPPAGEEKRKSSTDTGTFEQFL
jgi:hypothetical protein